MKRILVALDYDDTCSSVFGQAIELARATQAALNLLNVSAPEIDASLSFPPYSDRDFSAQATQSREGETASAKLLEELAEKAKAAGIETEFTSIAGSPGSTICQLAKTWEADWIVMGSHGRKGLREILLGSVSNYVVHHAPCSVTIVRDADLG